MLSDCLTIIGISFASAVLGEGNDTFSVETNARFSDCRRCLYRVAISWLLIYRTEDYKRLKESIDALSKKRRTALAHRFGLWRPLIALCVACSRQEEGDGGSARQTEDQRQEGMLLHARCM
jgi:hypothetical protein